jgi:hypothetical protein
VSALIALFLLTNPDAGATVQTTQYEGPRPELYVMPLAASRYGLPDGYAEACALFDEATHDYEAKKPEKAAPKFIKVAQLLKAPKERTTYSSQFTKMRSITYRDAAIAFEQAGKQAEGRKALKAAVTADPDNAALLEGLLKKLE